MTKQEALEILKEYQLWQRGIAPYDVFRELLYTHKQVGEAIDVAIKELGDV